MSLSASIHRLDTMSVLRRRLEEGEPAQAILDDMVAYIVANDPPDPSIIADCIGYLADRGARVATDEPDCALGKLITGPSRARPGLYLDVANKLAGKPGQLPFHVLARHGDLLITQSLLSNPRMMAALRGKDPQGRTVSHWLWDECSDMVKQSNAAHDCDYGSNASVLWSGSVVTTWLAQHRLLERGIGMDDPDDNGITALDLCAQRLADGSAVAIPGNAASDLVQAILSSRDMHARTPQATATGPARARPRM